VVYSVTPIENKHRTPGTPLASAVGDPLTDGLGDVLGDPATMVQGYFQCHPFSVIACFTNVFEKGVLKNLHFLANCPNLLRSYLATANQKNDSKCCHYFKVLLYYKKNTEHVVKRRNLQINL
jgi:hypothetical protein